MNSLVEAMNGAISSAVQRAGPQVHFIDYDYDVGASKGRFCQPEQDENSGKGANLIDVFFYQMKTEDLPWLDPQGDIDEDSGYELKRDLVEEDGVQPVNNTLSSMYAALIQAALEENGRQNGDDYLVVEDDNANLELEAEVDEAQPHTQSRVALSSLGRYGGKLNSSDSSDTFWNATHHLDEASVPSRNQSLIILGSKVQTGQSNAPASFAAWRTNMHFTNSTARQNDSSVGTVISNQTHILLAGSKPVQKSIITKLFVGDKTARIFHPTQGGHALIANMILYYMAADNARRLGRPVLRFLQK